RPIFLVGVKHVAVGGQQPVQAAGNDAVAGVEAGLVVAGLGDGAGGAGQVHLGQHGGGGPAAHAALFGGGNLVFGKAVLLGKSQVVNDLLVH
nr:hypothetical protein [Tanacetum cinerariifolium]